MTARTPGPIIVVIDPAPIVIRGPAPRFIPDPRPAIGRAPGPVAVTIGRPVVVDIDYGRVRTPDPTIVRHIRPIAISIEIFSAPNVFIIVLNVVMRSLGQIALAIIHPTV